MDEINAPDVVRVFRAQADDGAIFMIKTFSFLVALWELQTFFAPYPFDFLVIDGPTFNS